MGGAVESADRPVSVVDATAEEIPEAVEPLFRDYGRWVARRLGEDFGMTFTDADQERHHEAFRAELPRLLGPRGRLLVARLGDDAVGVGTLKPVDAAVAEIKRMYVRPAARGRGVGRGLLTRLLGDARAERYATVRLETLQFMTTAHALYRAAGFVETPPFDGAEVADSPLAPHTLFMGLRL